jgi:hypothetical protein
MSFTLMVDPRFVTRAGCEQKGLVAKGYDPAEIECFRTRNAIHSPGSARVCGDQVCAVSSTRPDLIVIDDAHPAQ